MSIIKNLSNVFTEELNEEIKRLEAAIEHLKEQAAIGEDAMNRLRIENYALKMRLSQSHLRDPKTGRIMPRGKHFS
jgi:regulator of replication initiation timing